MAKKLKNVSSDPQSPDLDPLAREIMERYKTACAHVSGWETLAEEDYNFALGQQWTEGEKAELKQQGRPAMTFNRIRPIINLVSGYQRENSSRIKVNPEGGEDQVFSEVMDRLLKGMDKWSNLDYKLGYYFDDGLTCGKGWMEALVSYDRDPIRGEIVFQQRHYKQVKVDPESREYDINRDARFLFKTVKLPKSTLKELYPKKARLIEGFVKDEDNAVENGSGVLQEGEDDDYGNKPNITMVVKRSDASSENELEMDDRFTVKEYWRYKLVPKWFVVEKESGEPRRFDSEKDAQAFIANENQGFGKPVERKVKEMWVAAMVAGFVLQDEISPFEPYYHGFPFFRFLADWAPNAETEELRVQGMVRALKDPQREKNKSKSQNLHILNTQANSGWIGDDEALTHQGWNDLKKMGSKPGIVIKKKKGYELREILPKGPNSGQIQREQSADEEFKQISTINPDLLGMQEGTSSGRAISLRIKQAIMSLVRLFSNYRYSKEIIGNFMLEVVPMVFDAKKVKKVLGPEYLSKSTDPEKYPNGMSDGVIEGFLQLVKDHKYDVYVAEAGQNQTIRYEIFQELTELLKAGAPIPIELLIDYMDLPNAQEVKQKVAQQKQEQLQMAMTQKNGKQVA